VDYKHPAVADCHALLFGLYEPGQGAKGGDGYALVCQD
jgi:hypothetical protein